VGAKNIIGFSVGNFFLILIKHTEKMLFFIFRIFFYFSPKKIRKKCFFFHFSKKIVFLGLGLGLRIGL